MARLEDMHVDIEVVKGSDAVRIALIGSATELALQRCDGGVHSEYEMKAYEAALAFLQYQYELEKPVVVIPIPKEPS